MADSLPLDRLARLDNYGHSLTSTAYLYRPTRAEQVAELFALARERGMSIALRGGGRSYGDAALNAGQVVVDFRRMNRILEWNPESGVIRLEPGVTIEQLWQHTLEDGWWSPVVPGTMFPTLGGCLGANVHGKNNWKAGTLGEHVLEFTALLPNGEQITCTPDENADLFYAMIGGMGVLGVFTSITLQMKPVYSGELDVQAWTEPNLGGILEALEAGKDNDYNVAWVDCIAGGRGLGRGQMHVADYPALGDDPLAQQTLLVDNQVLPDTFFGLVPKSILWKFMRPFLNNPGVRLVNTARYLMSRTLGNNKRYRQSLIAFNFLLDYVPNWEFSYGSGGLIQFQCFLPKENALDGYGEMLRLCKRRRQPSYLGVMKRHRPDPFLLSHALDGFSLAMDFKVTRRNRARLQKLAYELAEIGEAVGGRFYFAKDSTLQAGQVARYLGEDTVKRFKALKARVDPEGLLQSDLYRRWFGEPG